MSNPDRGYDREFTPAVSGRARRRVGYSRSEGEITRFVVQLEYRLGGEWTPVVRYDHGPGAGEHDVRDEGLHIDIYRNGEKAATEYIAPPEPADRAFTRAENHLAENLQRYIKRFEQWHNVNPRGSDP